MLERIEYLEKEMDNMRAVLTRLFASAGDEKKRIERKMAEQECRIDDQDRRIAAQANQIEALVELLWSYPNQGPFPLPHVPLASPGD